MEGCFEVQKGLVELGLLVVGPGGCVQGVQFGGGLCQPFDAGFRALFLPEAWLFACGLPGGLLLVFFPGGDHGAGLLLAGNGNKGFGGDAGVASAFIPDLLGQPVECKVVRDGGTCFTYYST